MAVRAEPTPAWQRGKVASWLVTTDHKRIGILYISTALVFFVLAGLMALVFRLQLSQAERGRLERRALQRAHHDPRHGDDLPRRRPDPRRLRELPRAADDRRAGRGVPAPERPFVLAVRARRHDPDAQLLRRRGRRAGGLDALPAALGAAARERHGPLDPLAPHPLRGLARRRDQLHRDDPQHAHPRDDVDAHAALRVVDPALRLAARGDPPGALGRR